MKSSRSNRVQKGFTLLELLIVIFILGILTIIALPVYINTVQSSQQGSANSNARALATAVQARAINSGAYDTVVADYASDMGGALPMNPCTGTATGYTITATSYSATVTAIEGAGCGSWTPNPYTLKR